MPGKPFIIPIFLPNNGCPHRCIFCDQQSVTGVNHKTPDAETVRAEIEKFLTYRHKQRETTQIAFYGGNFLGLDAKDMEMLLCEAAKFIAQGTVDSIRFSTRPDTINENQINRIRNFPVSVIEIGTQSMDDRVLALSNRGHTALDTENAVHILKSEGYKTGIHMMVGLPGDDDANAMETGKKIARLCPDFVRIHPTIVVKNSALAHKYHAGQYNPMSIDHAVSLVKKLYLFFRENNIPVIRMGLQASEALDSGSFLAGPYHPAFGHLVRSEIFMDIAVSAIKTANISSDTLFIKVHPKNVSIMQGIRSQNIKRLKDIFFFKSIKVIQDASIGDLSIAVNSGQ